MARFFVKAGRVIINLERIDYFDEGADEGKAGARAVFSGHNRVPIDAAAWEALRPAVFDLILPRPPGVPAVPRTSDDSQEVPTPGDEHGDGPDDNPALLTRRPRGAGAVGPRNRGARTTGPPPETPAS